MPCQALPYLTLPNQTQHPPVYANLASDWTTVTRRRGGSSALNSSSVTSVGTTCRGISTRVLTLMAPRISPASAICRSTPAEINPSSIRLASPVSQ